LNIRHAGVELAPDVIRGRYLGWGWVDKLQNLDSRLRGNDGEETVGFEPRID